MSLIVGIVVGTEVPRRLSMWQPIRSPNCKLQLPGFRCGRAFRSQSGEVPTQLPSPPSYPQSCGMDVGSAAFRVSVARGVFGEFTLEGPPVQADELGGL